MRQWFAGPVLRIRHALGDQRAQDLAPQRPLVRLLGEVQWLGRVEQAKDVAVGAVPEGAQQGGGRKLLFLVDVDEHHVVDIHRELHPRAAKRDDARTVELLPVGVHRLLEDDAG